MLMQIKATELTVTTWRQEKNNGLKDCRAMPQSLNITTLNYFKNQIKVQSLPKIVKNK